MTIQYEAILPNSIILTWHWSETAQLKVPPHQKKTIILPKWKLKILHQVYLNQLYQGNLLLGIDNRVVGRQGILLSRKQFIRKQNGPKYSF